MATEAGPLDDLLGHSITYRIAVGPRAGQKLFALCGDAAGVWRGSDQAIGAAACGDELGTTAEASVRCGDRELHALAGS